MADTRVVELVVDRVEGDVAVLEVAGTQVDWPLAALPDGVVEGQRMSFTISRVSSDTRQEAEARARLDRLRAKGPPPGDVDL